MIRSCPLRHQTPISAAACWDPCATGKPARGRHVSVHPSELPAPWQTALRRAASGLPGRDAGAPCRDVLLRMLQKLCQFHWACVETGRSVELSTQAITVFFDALEKRLEARKSGIRWATMRATAEELERFARYSGLIDEEAHLHLKASLHRYAQRERGQDALKFVALFETGHTPVSVLERASELVQEAATMARPSARHRLRTAAAILALAAVLGLRNANSQLVLGRDLLWEVDQWVLDTDIIKTRGRNGERLVVPLRPEFGAFIDTALRGDEPASALPRIRAEVCATMRPLIVRSDGQVPNPGYAARVFRLHTGNTLTSTRTMLHTDQAVRRGENGTRDTMAVLHQRSRQIAELYQGRAVRQAAVQRAQMGLSEKQAAALDDDQNEALAALRHAFGENGS